MLARCGFLFAIRRNCFKCFSVQNNGYCRKQALERCKAQITWDKQSVEAWLAEAARKDEDAVIIEKYARVDNVKIKAIYFMFYTTITQQLQLEGCIDDERQFKTAKRSQAPAVTPLFRIGFFRDNFVTFRPRSKRITFLESVNFSTCVYMQIFNFRDVT